MKKKIINGFLMVALLAATVTSFVSCKDNNEDVKTDLLAQIDQQKCTCNQAWLQADQTLLAQIQADLANYAKLTDIPGAPDLSIYAKLSDIPDLSTYAKLADIPDLSNYAKLTDIPDISNLVTNETFNTTIAELAGKGYVQHEVDSLWDALNDLNDPASIASKIKDVNDKLTQQDTDLKAVQKDLGEAETKLKDIQHKIDKIVEALKNMVTSVTINATANSILSNSKVFPGLDMQIVGAAYGEPINGKGAFPSKDSGLSEDAIAGVENLEGYYEWKDGQLITNEKEIETNGEKKTFNAGKIYFTLNPSNTDPNNLKSLTLVNSQNQEIFELGDATKSKDILTWGITRSEFDPTLWEAPVKYDAESVKALNLKEIINFNALKNNVKNIINEAKNVDSKSSAKSAAKTVLKETAGAVATLLNSKIPAMQAVALKATWEDTVGVRSVLSDYSIAATAYKPLSFSEFNGVSLGTDIDFTKVDNFFKKIVDKVMKEVNGINLNNIKINTITYNANDYNVSKDIWILVEKKYLKDATIGSYVDDVVISLEVTDKNANTPFAYGVGSFDERVDGVGSWYTVQKESIDADLSKAIANMIGSKEDNTGINGTLGSLEDVVNQVKNLIQKANDAATKAKDIEDRVTDYLEKYINKTINFISTGRFLEPILLVNSNDGIRRATGTYEAGKYTFVPTTMSYELVAPAFKKYIAVLDKDGKVIAGSQKILTKGDKDFNSVEVELTKDAAQIVYAAMDFRGYQVAKVYNVTVE